MSVRKEDVPNKTESQSIIEAVIEFHSLLVWFSLSLSLSLSLSHFSNNSSNGLQVTRNHWLNVCSTLNTLSLFLSLPLSRTFARETQHRIYFFFSLFPFSLNLSYFLVVFLEKEEFCKWEVEKNSMKFCVFVFRHWPVHQSVFGLFVETHTV